MRTPITKYINLAFLFIIRMLNRVRPWLYKKSRNVASVVTVRFRRGEIFNDCQLIKDSGLFDEKYYLLRMMRTWHFW